MVWILGILLLLILTNLSSNNDNYSTQKQIQVGDFTLYFDKSDNKIDYCWRCAIYADGNLLFDIVGDNLQDVINRVFYEISLSNSTSRKLQQQLPYIARQTFCELNDNTNDNNFNDFLVNLSGGIIMTLFVSILCLGMYKFIIAP